MERLPSDRIDRLPPSLEIVFIGASESSRLHLRFLGDPTPADVLAFPHGEIVVCPAVAAALCKGHNLSFQDELLTYLLHGILHLAGYRDSNRSGALSMRGIQCRLRRPPKKRGG